MAANGGMITKKDFANYQVKMRKPILSEFAGYTLYGFPPPSSGGVHVAQILNIMEEFDLDKLAPAERYHLIAEAMKFAFVPLVMHQLAKDIFGKPSMPQQ